MSTLSITIIAILLVVIVLMAYPAWLMYMIMSDKDIVRQIANAKNRIDKFEALSKHNQEYGDKVRAEWSHDPSLSPTDDEVKMQSTEWVTSDHPGYHLRVSRNPFTGEEIPAGGDRPNVLEVVGKVGAMNDFKRNRDNIRKMDANSFKPEPLDGEGTA